MAHKRNVEIALLIIRILQNKEKNSFYRGNESDDIKKMEVDCRRIAKLVMVQRDK